MTQIRVTKFNSGDETYSGAFYPKAVVTLLVTGLKKEGHNCQLAKICYQVNEPLESILIYSGASDRWTGGHKISRVVYEQKLI